MVLKHIMDIIFGLLSLMVGLLVLFNLGPGLIGYSVSATQTGYILNATACYIDQPTPISDVPVNGSYCALQTLWPLILPLVFIVIVLGVIFAVLKGYTKV